MESSRSTYRGQVKRISNAATEYLSSTTSRVIDENSANLDSIEEELIVMNQRLSAAHENLSRINTEMHSAVNAKEDAEKEWEKIVEYEDLAIGVLARIRQRLNKVNEKRTSHATVSSNENQSSSLRSEGYATKLPKLQLRKFSGTLKEWIPFWEQFKSAVHENNSLTGAEKFNYLRSVLIGNAEKTIAGFTPSVLCYDGAIALLQEEYGNTEKLVDDNMQQLMSLQPIQQKSDAAKLRNLYNLVMSCTRSLTALGIPTSHYYIMLKTVLLRCLPSDLRLEYHRTCTHDERFAEVKEEKTSKREVDDEGNTSTDGTSASTLASDGTPVQHILRFIKREVESLEKASIERERQAPTHAKRYTTAAAMTITANELCLFCKSSQHSSTECDASNTLDQRKEMLKREGRCFRCLKPGHRSKLCKVKLTCRNCKGRHSTSLCDPKYVSKNRVNVSGTKEIGNITDTQQTLNLCAYNTPLAFTNVLLQTARVLISEVNKDQKLLIRLIIDSGSHYSYICESVAKKLNLPVVGAQNLNLVTFGSDEKSAGMEYKQVRLKLRSQFDNSSIIMDALVVPKICADILPAPNQRLPLLRQYALADSQVSDLNLEDGLSILVGSDFYWTIVTGRQERITSRLSAVETIFGWTLHGPIVLNSAELDVREKSSLSLSIFVEKDIAKLWNLDVLGISNEEDNPREAFNSLQDCIKKKGDHYEAVLPWKNPEIIMDKNREGALVRLRSLVKRLSRDPVKLIEYDKEMREYINAGYAELVRNECEGKRIYYMPHRPVYRIDKPTTKIRIVFDASAHAPSASSLNDNLYTGENLLPDVLKIILNFRLGHIGLVSDLKKAFLQIVLGETDRDAHRFFWYSKPVNVNDDLPPMAVYRMTRVTFGVTSSPFHLTATIRKHLADQSSRYPEICSVLKDSFYMDDLILSVDDDSQAARVYNEATTVMNHASMRLSKWNSSSRKIRALFARKGEECPAVQRVLGIVWYPLSDDITVNLESITEFIRTNLAMTKRGVLQVISRLFDPLGMFGPIMIRMKIIFQELWKRKIGWDEPLDENLNKQLTVSSKDLLTLSDFSLSRCVLNISHSRTMQVHIFADASLHAYGAVVYVRTVDLQGTVTNHLLCSKSRVAPIKMDGTGELTLPRLELTAALIASRLCAYLKKSLKITFHNYFLWSDSQITLHWIKGQASRWKPYVRNRVEEIQRLTSEDGWRYCPSKDNPADLLTRGVDAKFLIKSDLWKNGPNWLQGNTDDLWPSGVELEAESVPVTLLVQSSNVSSALRINTCQPLLPFTEFSSWKRLVRVTAWILRFTRRIKDKPLTKFLTAEEIYRAQLYWIKYIQRTQYMEDINALHNKQEISRSSKLLTLNPILDSEGLLRVTGRLQVLDDNPNVLHPIILPKSSPITELLVKYTHELALHSGINTVLAKLREKYWIPRARPLVKYVTKHCIICKKLTGKSACQPFAPLPKERLISSKPFETVGVDFAGPLFVKTTTDINTSKCYIMILTCAVVRAIHLELVPTLTTESCLSALRRFVARRGTPKLIFSDNAKTFRRAALEVSNVDIIDNEIFNGFLSQRGISWRFIVERAPWWGGFWERMVRSVKLVLRAVIGKKTLNFEQMETLLAEAESVINSRPLTYISDDPLDLSPLTPAHFLTGYGGNSQTPNEFPSLAAEDIRRKWNLRLRLIRSLWKRWRHEYLQLLRSVHHVKPSSSTVMKPGKVVLVFDQAKPRILWKLAVIESAFEGRDGKVRACELRFADGTILRRPVQLLYPLEIN